MGSSCTCGFVTDRQGNVIGRIPDPHCPVHKGS